MADGVLGQRLQDQRRNGRRARGRLDVDGVGHAVGETRALDVEVAAQHLRLRLDGDALAAFVVERVAEDVAQAGDHRHGLVVLVRPHQRGHRVQRVEEKVRLQLQLQRVQLRLRQRGLQLRRLDLPLAVARVVVDGLQRAGDGGVEDQLYRQAEEEVRRDVDLRPCRGHPVVGTHRHGEHQPVRAVGDAEDACG